MNQPPSYGLDEVNVSFLPSNDNDRPSTAMKTLPLVVSPRWDDSLGFLCNFMEMNRSWLDGMILQYGAVLIRGFDVSSCAEFEQAVMSYQPNLNDTYRGTSPRVLMDGTKYVFSAADVPVNYPIAQHCEMSFLPAPPRQLFFGCIKESKLSGGETALCDFRKVYRDISPELRHKFLTKKIRYIRTHHKVGEYFTFDVAAMLGWPEMFGTSDPKEVERLCLAEDSPMVRWTGPHDDTFVQEWESEAFQHHPVKNEPVWFNHTQVFHWTTFPAELWYAFCRIGEVRLLIHCILVSIFSVFKYWLLGFKMSLYSCFGDGTPITVKEMQEIRDAIHRNMVFSRWKKGDIMCIDNFSTSHGRQPTYDKGRKVVVAWAEPFRKTDSFSLATVKETPSSEPEDNNQAVECSNPQERTPESTLTSSEAQVLNESFINKRFKDEFGKEEKRSSMPGQNPQAVQTTHTAAFGSLKRRNSWSPRDKVALLHADSDFWKALEK